MMSTFCWRVSLSTLFSPNPWRMRRLNRWRLIVLVFSVFGIDKPRVSTACPDKGFGSFAGWRRVLLSHVQGFGVYAKESEK